MIAVLGLKKNYEINTPHRFHGADVGPVVRHHELKTHRGLPGYDPAAGTLLHRFFAQHVSASSNLDLVNLIVFLFLY